MGPLVFQTCSERLPLSRFGHFVHQAQQWLENELMAYIFLVLLPTNCIFTRCMLFFVSHFEEHSPAYKESHVLRIETEKILIPEEFLGTF